MPEPAAQAQTEALYQQCAHLFVHGHYEESLQLINQLIALDECNPTYYSDRADTYYALDEYRNAASDYERAIALQPTGTYARINLGVTYEKLQRFEEALSQFDAVVALQTEHVAIAHHNRGDVLCSLQRLPEALDAFTQAIKCWPDFAGAYLNRGHILSRLGRQEEARADYDQAYTLGEDADINIAWTVTWSRFERTPESVDPNRLLAIAELIPRDLHYVHHVCHAVVALLRNDFPAALSAIHLAAQMEPMQWDPPFWQGMIAAWTGDYTSARHSIDHALTLGLPPAFLQPLYWLQTTHASFFEQYASAILQHGA